MKKILLTGSNGMLGKYLLKFLEDRRDFKIINPDRQEFNISDTNKIENYIKEIKPDIIFHLAAETNVDLCETNPRHALITNSLSVEKISKIANELSCYLVFISTSNVFGGKSSLKYNELDIPDPVNYYGKSKHKAETFITQNNVNNSLIIRAGWMIGGGVERDKKFVGKIIHQIKEGSSSVKAVGDKYGTITMASSLAKFIIKSMEDNLIGTYHYASNGLLTRYDIAKIIIKELNCNVSLFETKSCQFPLPASRPVSEGIESLYLDEKDGIRHYEEDLHEYIKEFK